MMVQQRLRANPGGEIAPAEVFGRDRLIQSLWRVLERQSLVLSAERRMGKTCVVKKMTKEGKANYLTVYRDLEGVRSPIEFVEIIFQDVESHLSSVKRLATGTRKLLTELGGTEIAGMIKFPEVDAAHWKQLLMTMAEDLVKQLDNQKLTMVFFWDEMPLMLYNIKNRQGEDAAMEVLDALRSLRQMFPQLRMVFTGSIGLHNVLTGLKRAGYANDPTNDMKKEDVPPLALADAEELAYRLLAGEGIVSIDGKETAKAIAKSVDGMPYFIHHIIDQLFTQNSNASAEKVEEIVSNYLIDPNDPWHLRYYSERIDVYYPNDQKPLALAILDILAVTQQPLPFEDLFNQLHTHINNPDKEQTRSVLTLLECDHYVIRKLEGGLCFRFPLIQRCWRLHRGLAA
ncbi:MAG TPA: hypothetical protein V6D25_30560 [Leptolyngbyaceae cyanobacterium]